MRRFPGWSIVVVCSTYMIAVTAGTLAWLHRWARTELRASSTNADEVFVVLHFRVWWFALLISPPLAFAVAWIWRRAATPRH